VCGLRVVVLKKRLIPFDCVLITGRKYQKSVERLQASLDKMHKKGLTVEQYLSSVLAAVCVSVFMLCAFVASLKGTLINSDRMSNGALFTSSYVYLLYH